MGNTGKNFAKKISNRIMMLDEGKIVDDTDIKNHLIL